MGDILTNDSRYQARYKAALVDENFKKEGNYKL
jgi:hypothetical protein